MKIDPRDLPRDRCETSLSMLGAAVREWFRSHREFSTIWVADHEPAPSIPGNEIDVVLFGGFLRRFLESGNWTWPRSRLWVVGTAARDVLVRQLGFRESQVGVIPREELFPVSVITDEFPKAALPVDWVFAGRISPTKNIRFLLRVVSALQTEWNLPVRLNLFGEVGHDPHPDQGRRMPEDHADVLERDLRELPFSERPRFHGLRDPREWPLQEFENPVFVNFSTSIFEDFGVSLAQARQVGWPCLISDWGGHRDVHGRGVRKVPADRIGSTHEPEEWLNLKARALAAELARDASFDAEASGGPAVTGIPDLISLEEIDALRRRVLKATGPDLHWVLREGIETFADTSAGAEFFRRYRLHFGPKDPSATGWVAVINDLHVSTDPALARAGDFCHAWVTEAAKERASLRFLSMRELNRPENLVPLLAASRVLVPAWNDEIRSVLSPLLARLPETCAVSVGGLS